MLTPSRGLYGLGVILLLALSICSRNFGDRGGPYFMASLTVAGIAYLLAICEFFDTPKFQGRVVVIGLALAALWHIAFLSTPPGPDDDIHRYLWDGRLQRLGYNPYVVVPGDPTLAGLHTLETRTLNHPDLPSPYPAGAELFFRAVTAIHESVFSLKVAFVACDLAIVLVLLDILRRSGQGAHWVLAYAWNPLLAVEVAGSGHIDIVGALLLLVSFAALGRRWRVVAALSFGLAVSMKLLPIVLLPLYWKRVRTRDAALAATLVGLLYVPFLNHGRIPIGSLGTYVQSFRFNDPVFAMLERVASPQLVAGLAVLVGVFTAIWMRRKSETLSADAFAWPMAASLLCAPVVYPWYLLWLLPFLRSASTVPIIIWTVSIIPTYYVWHLRTLGRPWLLPGWIMLLEYGCVAIAGAIVAFRRFTPRGVRYNSQPTKQT
jgi:alpha-1,6-mannosyltransferase